MIPHLTWINRLAFTRRNNGTQNLSFGHENSYEYCKGVRRPLVEFEPLVVTTITKMDYFFLLAWIVLPRFESAASIVFAPLPESEEWGILVEVVSLD